MIGRLNHVAIAVRDIAKASKVYRDTLGADVSAKVPHPDHAGTAVQQIHQCDVDVVDPLPAIL